MNRREGVGGPGFPLWATDDRDRARRVKMISGRRHSMVPDYPPGQFSAESAGFLFMVGMSLSCNTIVNNMKQQFGRVRMPQPDPYVFGVLTMLACVYSIGTSRTLLRSSETSRLLKSANMSCGPDRESEPVDNLMPRTKYILSTLDKHPGSARQTIENAVKFASCRHFCDSRPEWEQLPLWRPLDVVSNSTVKEVDTDYNYLKLLRLNNGWNRTAWTAHDRRQAECNFVCEIPHAFVDELGHVCAVNDGVCFIQHDCLLSAPNLPADVSKLPRYDKVLVISQEWGYAVYHGILESMIKLGDVLNVLQGDQNIRVHVPEVSGNVAILFPPILADLGIKPSRLVHGHLIADMLMMPRATPCMNPSTRQLLHFRQVIENTDCYRKYSHPPSNATVILLVAREPGTMRSFVNHEQLKRALLNFSERRSYVLREYSSPGRPPQLGGPPRVKCGIIQDMLLFKDSKVIVAPHGAGLTNILLCDPGTIIVETQPADAYLGRTRAFTSISMRLGLRHMSLIDAASNHSTPMTANVSAIMKTLAVVM